MKKERFKSFVLIVLLIISVLQMGIIWSNDDHSSPFYFAARMLNIPGSWPERAAAEAPGWNPDAKHILLNPFRVSLSTGDEHYIVPRNSEGFASIKDTVYSLFEEALEGRAQRRDLPEGAWETIVSRRSILFEFKMPIPLDVIKWGIDFYNVSSGAPADIYKVLIIPREGAGVGFYILTSTGVIHFLPRTVTVAEIERLYAAALEAIDVDNMNVIKYAMVHEFGGHAYPGFRGDVKGNIYGRQSTIFRNLKHAVPFFVRSAEFANTVLGDDINSYSRQNEGVNNTMIFKNFSNLYRFHGSGLMEYSFIPTVSPHDKGDIFLALSQSMTFIQRIKNDLLREPELYLSGISQDEASWQFTFDYIFGDFPVFFYNETVMMDEVLVQDNALVIRANGKRAISCRWVLVDMFFGNDIRELQTAFDTIDVTNFSRMSVDDISIVYHFDMTDEGRQPGEGASIRPAWPVWRIEGPGGEAQFVPLRETRGN